MPRVLDDDTRRHLARLAECEPATVAALASGAPVPPRARAGILAAALQCRVLEVLPMTLRAEALAMRDAREQAARQTSAAPRTPTRDIASRGRASVAPARRNRGAR